MNVIFPESGQHQNSQDSNHFPKVKKSCRSFKEVAEVAISQLEFLLQRDFLTSGVQDNHSPQSKLSTMRQTVGVDDMELHQM